jgi:carboxylate-amine ligase
VEDAVTIAALARALVDTAAAEDVGASGWPVPVLRAAAWRAARFGMGDDLLDLRGRTPVRVPAWDLAGGLVEQVRGALGDDESLVRDGLAAIRRRGTGAERQSAAWRDGGYDAVLRAVTVG